jgi:hypothetical protein
MSIMEFIAMLGLCLTCLSFGYTIGKDNDKTQK